MSLATLTLKKDEERRLRAGHLWIYSNEIDTHKTPLKNFNVGDLVRIESSQGKFYGIGTINPNTLLTARVLTTDRHTQIDTDFFKQRITQALALRQTLFPKPYYRLIYGESDGLPGVVVDRFGDVLVAQITTQGMERLRTVLFDALIKVLKPSAILARDDCSSRAIENLTGDITCIYGNVPKLVAIEENDVHFQIPIQIGQKTGWFYDHRENRARLKSLVQGKRVLDLFSYIGGWGVQVACFGAQRVTCLDSSAQALDWLMQNATLNHVADRINVIKQDAFVALDKMAAEQQKYDIIILDPPALIKRRKDIPAGLRAYQHLNQRALELLGDNGILVSASCSLHLAYHELIDCIRKASIHSQRTTRIFAQGHQGPDHPVHPAIPETNYLKSLFVSVSIN